ncbi:LysR family transcriptional regulator [Oryzifoliimicrobium ureilyticus]|uniref:LysR family transcriptional regulator n=1 Tax=Oryzifoliimicrobium ureilyticus TaxID=3113724 RepID=UPI00307643A5
MIELRHLRYAVAVAEERHITRAAERLGLQQPPLSQQIKALEDQLGVTLFHRLSRGVIPTAAGEAFVARARAILTDVDNAVEAARRSSRGEEGRLAIGFTGSAAFHPLVTGVVRELRDRAPLLKLTLEEANSSVAFEALRAGRLDAAFVRALPEAPEGVSARHLLDEDMLVAFPDSHPLLEGWPENQRRPLAALTQATFILYHRPSGAGLYDAIIAACDKAGFSPRVGQEATQMISTLSLVAAGLGISIVPVSMARLGTTGISYRRLKQEEGLSAPLFLIWRPGEESGPLARLLADVRRYNQAMGSR